MKPLLIPIILLQCYTAFAGTRPVEAADTTGDEHIEKQLTTAGRGLAPIQGGSFENPLVTAGLSFRSGRFSYDPNLSLGTNGKPWIANNALRFTILDGKKITATAGTNLFIVFADIPTSGKSHLSALRTLNYELTASVKTSSRHTLTLSYSYSQGLDSWCLSGNTYAIGSSLSILPNAPKWSFALDNQLFYLQLSQKTDGLFGSTRLTIRRKHSPVSFYSQGLLAIRTAYPIERTQFNAGICFTLR